MKSLMIRPQGSIIDNEVFYITFDIMTNIYYICYQELMMKVDTCNYVLNLECDFN